MMWILSFSLPVLLIIKCTVLTHEVASLASPNGNGGWKSRPKSAILQQYAEDATSKKVGKEGASSQSWDAVRFVKQSSRFITLPNPFDRRSEDGPLTVVPGDTLWQPGPPGSAVQWAPLDDVVMGGVSSSVFDNEVGDWVGTVSDSNSGGFIGIRTTPVVSALNMEACAGVEFLLRRGSGARRIKAVVRDSTEFNGVCWTTCFNMPAEVKKNPFASLFSKEGSEDEEVVSIRIPFRAQIPTIFSKTVPDQTFNIKNVVAFQLVYSKFEFDGVLNSNFSLGDFSLGIFEVRAY